MSYRVTKREFSPSRRQANLQQDRLLKAVIDSQDLPSKGVLDIPTKVAHTADNCTPDTLAATASKRPLLGSDRSAKRQRLSPGIPTLEVDKTWDIHHPRPIKAAFLQQVEDPSESSVDECVSRWLESLHSDRHSASRSDSCFEQGNRHHLDPTPRPKSVSEMDNRRDKDGFAVPNTPSSGISQTRSRQSAGNRSDAQSDYSRSSSLSKRSLVEDTAYLGKNLRKNNIFLQGTLEARPQHVTEAVSYARRDRDSPGPSSDEVMRDGVLEGLSLNVDESEVEEYFSRTVFPFNTAADTIQVARRVPMPKDTVPNFAGNGGDRISNPVPDMIYGYNRQNAFSDAQMNHLDDMDLRVRATNGNQKTVYPFFVVEFKGSNGGLWVATNQCLGGTAACIGIAETLNQQLAQCGSEAVQRVNSTAFSIAMSGSEARLYVSWKHDELSYYTNRIGSFVLQEPEQFLQFRKHVRNIVDWGRDRRLKEIQTAIDAILEEERKAASALAKARPPPHAGSDASSTHSGGSRRKKR